METLFAQTSIGITDLKKTPSAVIREAGSATVVVLHHNKPSAYLVSVKTYEVMMELMEDLRIALLIRQRLAEWEADPSAAVEVSLEDLASQAQLKVARQDKGRVRSRPVLAHKP